VTVQQKTPERDSSDSSSSKTCESVAEKRVALSFPPQHSRKPLTDGPNMRASKQAPPKPVSLPKGTSILAKAKDHNEEARAEMTSQRFGMEQ
jgi:hypothetical protein